MLLQKYSLIPNSPNGYVVSSTFNDKIDIIEIQKI